MMAEKTPSAIWWVRRDLRLVDNQALTAAKDAAQQVVPLFILDSRLLSSPYAGQKRKAFLFAGLRQLDRELQEIGSRLIVRAGDPLAVLQQVMQESGASAVFAEEDYSPFAKKRDGRVASELPLTLCPGLLVHPPEMVLKDNGDPYIVYTPFSKVWKSRPRPAKDDLLPAPDALETPGDLHSQEIPKEPAVPEGVPFEAGTAAALNILQDFIDHKVYNYKKERNRPDLESTSKLSPYLRLGMISIRQAVAAAGEAITKAADGESRQGAETFLNELIWREFYINILAHYPHARAGSFREKYDQISWDNNKTSFEAWKAGKTGFPIVDAAMRQLINMGWMHNRTRMITASFLVKDLLIDWRWGEKFFMQHLVDGDPASNNGGWQWTAGTGTDAAPYFRIFNPTLQGKKFDPHGRYIRQWLPELAGVPDNYIHEPWKMPDDVQKETGCRIGDDYPQPMVDHKVARKRTLAAYQAISD